MGRVALGTGANQGLGFARAEGLARAATQTAATGRSSPPSARGNGPFLALGRSKLGTALVEPTRAAHEAEPSHVWGLPAQHQRSLGRPLLTQMAVTRRSPQREPSSEKPALRDTTSG